MPARGLSFNFAAWRYKGGMSSCQGAIARCVLVRRAEGARSRLLGRSRVVANVNNEIIAAFFPQPLQRKQHL